MKKLLTLLTVVTGFICQPSTACDENCLREKAQAKYNVTFPSFLTQKYCDGIKMDFMRSTVRSLDKYRSENFNTKFKGPLKNTRNYLTQRKEWLQECDDYLSKTQNIRVFGNDKTTKQIFASIDRVNAEFSDLIKGVSYASDGEAKVVMDEKIDVLFQLVDDHKTLLHLKGKYVVR